MITISTTKLRQNLQILDNIKEEDAWVNSVKDDQ